MGDPCRETQWVSLFQKRPEEKSVVVTPSLAVLLPYPAWNKSCFPFSNCSSNCKPPGPFLSSWWDSYRWGRQDQDDSLLRVHHWGKPCRTTPTCSGSPAFPFVLTVLNNRTEDRVLLTSYRHTDCYMAYITALCRGLLCDCRFSISSSEGTNIWRRPLRMKSKRWSLHNT